MKKIKMGLMALAGIIGIGGAFAFKPAKVAGATYYGYRINSTTVGWATSPPDMTSCQSGGAIACTITSTTAPATVLTTTNAFPANYSVKNSSGGKLYN